MGLLEILIYSIFRILKKEFDLIVFNESIYYSKNFNQLLSNASNVLVKSGSIMISTYQGDGLQAVNSDWFNSEKTNIFQEKNNFSINDIIHVTNIKRSLSWEIFTLSRLRTSV